jgi:putative ABC transport system permease protein
VFRIALRGVLARKLRLALTAASVVLGVGFVAGTLVLTDTLNATFDVLFGNAEKGVAVVVRGQQGFDASTDGSAVEERTLVPARVRAEVAAVPGVASAIGLADGYAQVVFRGQAVTNGAAPNLGLAWAGDSPANPLHVVSGRPPVTPGEVVIDERSATKYDIAAGANVSVVVSGRSIPEQVVGIVRFGSGTSLGGATLTAFAPTQAQQLLLGRSGVWTTVQAVADPGVDQQTLRNRVAQALAGQPVQVLTQQDYVAAESTAVKKQFKFFSILLLVFAFISVFVAVFIIFNTFTVLVAQRTRELALLRALGAARRQVLSSVLLEALLVGALSGAIGLGVGVLVALGLEALIRLFGGGLDTVSLQVLPRTVVVAMLVGVLVTAVAAAVPAVRAGRIAPVAAMRDDPPPAASLRRRSWIGLALLIVGAALLIGGVRGGPPLLIGVGALLMFRGAISLSPVLSRPIVGALGAALPRFWGTAGRLARENALRNPRRTAATASALMIGVALTTAMSIMAASITSSIDAVIDTSVGADFLITANNFQPISDAVRINVSQVPDVGAVTAFRAGEMRVAGSAKQVQGVTADTVADTLRLTPVSGTMTALSDGEVLVSQQAADDHHLQVGSSLPVQFATTGNATLHVAGIYEKNPIAGDYLISMGTYDANFRNRLDVVVAVTAAAGADLGAIRAGLARALKPTPGVQLRDQSEFKANQKHNIDQVLTFVLALLLLSLIIAWLGIVNTLALSVIERTREIGLLRAVGMATRQVRRMIRLEAVVISVFGALLGVVLGLGYGVALVQTLAAQGIDRTSIPVGRLLGYLVIAVIAGLTAAWWPARRASRLDVLQAIATE